MSDERKLIIQPEDFESAYSKADKTGVLLPDEHRKLKDCAVGGVDSTIDYFVDMSSIKRKTPTGIPALDLSLGGGYVRGLNVFGGIPNCGKTTMLVQSALELSKRGQASVFLSYDMRGFEIMDKVYSQVSYELYGKDGYTLQDIAKRKLLVKSEENIALTRAVVDATQYFTVIDMLNEKNLQKITFEEYGEDTALEQIICIYSRVYKTPVFFIDNLQQMSGYLGNEGKAGIDKTLRLVKQYSSKYSVPIVLISTLGRAAYDKPIELSSFKESGNIDYDADLAFGIQPKFVGEDPASMTIDDFREAEQRDITIKCVKGRDTGFKKNDVTLNAPYCRFEPYDDTKPKPDKLKRKGIKFVDD